jgi:hypothetical protein
VTEETRHEADARTLWVDPDAGAVRRVPAARGPFVPILLGLLALTTWLAAQTVQLVGERRQLEAANTSLAPQEEAAKKMRASLDQVATATAKLAAEGNPNARVIVEQLRVRGITINPAAASAPR